MQVSIQNLSKTYKNGVKALDRVSLTIPRGMYGLLGPNGAGKSTLMRTLATLQDPDSGSAFLGDMDMLKQKDQVGLIAVAPLQQLADDGVHFVRDQRAPYDREPVLPRPRRDRVTGRVFALARRAGGRNSQYGDSHRRTMCLSVMRDG